MKASSLSKVGLVWMLLISNLHLVAGDISDPVVNFLATYHREPGDKVYRLKCDLGNNSGEAVFLAFSHDIGADGDGAWALYLKRGKKYVMPLRLEEDGLKTYAGAGFNIHRYVIGKIPEWGKYGLLTSDIVTGREGGIQLRAIILVGDCFKESDVGPFVGVNDHGAKPPGNRFPDPPTPAIEELNL